MMNRHRVPPRQVALDYRHDLPVLTVLILLCKEANAPGLTGTY